MTLNMINQTSLWQSQGDVVVLVTGVFDIIHIEHLRFLQKAKAVGNRLIVGVELDRRVKANKSQERPLNNQLIRLEQIQALKSVDHAFLLPELFDTQVDWEVFMSDMRPDIYAVSSHTNFIDNKRLICQKYNIQFKIVHEYNPAFSSTTLIDKIKATT